MSLIVRCNGCGTEVDEMSHGKDTGHALTGTRVGNVGGGGMPSGRFDLCVACGRIAFTAIRETRPPARPANLAERLNSMTLNQVISKGLHAALADVAEDFISAPDATAGLATGTSGEAIIRLTVEDIARIAADAVREWSKGA
ncbi:hypothetical protein GCM10009555_017750 [Acrocarpospora macrocephala]|uniref:Uncharacterized protein n=1 Tax=Acrocarpospora macrocephala TaxID=150177 RepID=A0A5M3WEB8_9ACTN|nr:hypothetical protein [Acrocarpospora macrocephala]GES07435.1 hypothetical protein Amac_010300 [Acrocarpospora macrocephala]